MKDKGSDTDEGLEVLLEDAMRDFSDKPHEDPPPPYKPPANPYPEIALSPAPQGGVLDAELLEDSAEIKKLNERIDKLEEKIRICCPEKEKEVSKKYTAYTENWVYLPQTDAFPGENHYPTHKSIEQGKKYTLAHDEGGFDWARGRAWIRSHTKEEVLADASNKGSKYQDAIKHNDTVYIVPGIDIKLLVDKSKEGYSIEFESDKDKKTFLEMGGENHNLKGSSKKKKNKKKSGLKKRRSSKKKKSRRSSKKKRSRRK